MIQYKDIKTSDFLGIPFVRGGRSLEKDGGYDCYGLLIKIFEEQGIKIPNFKSPDTYVEMHSLSEIEKKESCWQEIYKKNDDLLSLNLPQKGDVLLIEITGHICHVGYCINKDKFIHVWEKSNGVVVENISFWKRKIVGLYRYNG